MQRREYERVRKERQRKLKKNVEANQGDERGKRLEKYGKQRRRVNVAKKRQIYKELKLMSKNVLK